MTRRISPSPSALTSLLQLSPFSSSSFSPFLLHPTKHLKLNYPQVKSLLLKFSSSPIFPSQIRALNRATVIAASASLSTMSTGGNVAQFQLSPSSALKIQIGDITCWSVDGSSDAIVNPANERMLGGGGADGAIHRAAGPELREACYKVPEVRPGIRCPTGEARITPGFKLPASHVVHTVGPIYDVHPNAEALLQSAFRNSLKVAKENNIQYIAFPAISCGVFRYPIDEAANVALSTVSEFANDFKEVHFVLFSDDIYSAWVNKAKEIFGN